MTLEETNISLALVYADEKFGFLIVVTLLLLVIIKDIVKYRTQHPLSFF